MSNDTLELFWYCDACHGVITCARHGMLEWVRTYDTEQASGLRLVHHDAMSGQRHPTCQHDGERLHQSGLCLSDYHLHRWLGPDGLIDLSELLIHYWFKQSAEVLVMIWRLHVPGYEQARPHFTQAAKDGVIQSRSVPAYSQRELRSVLEAYAPEHLGYLPGANE